MKHCLEADGINLNFDLRNILSDVYIKCETGEITALLGRNGQGKSCLMNVILGNLRPSSSSVRIDNMPVSSAFKRPDLILYLPQFNFIPGSLKVKQVLDDFQLTRSDLENRFPEFISKSHFTINKLSGGERRLLEIFIIVKSPSLFALLDEPFTHLHPVQIDKVKQLLVAEKNNKGFLVTDHLYEHLLDISSSVYLLNDGQTHLITMKGDLDRLGYINL
jgi:ABC-type multidrug transport system ATPase subunit